VPALQATSASSAAQPGDDDAEGGTNLSTGQAVTLCPVFGDSELAVDV